MKRQATSSWRWMSIGTASYGPGPDRLHQVTVWDREYDTLTWVAPYPFYRKDFVLEELYTQYHKKLLTIAYRQVGDFDVAEEIVQRTFLSALVNKYDSRKGTSPLTWIITLLRWELYSYYQEQAEDRLSFGDLPGLDEIGEELGIYDSISLERMVDASLYIKRLPPSLRWIAEKYLLEGYTVEEIQKQCGGSKRGIERLITKIFRRFKE